MQRLRPPPAVDSGVVAAAQHSRARPSPRNSAGRVYCGSSSRPDCAEALGDRAGVVAHRPRQQAHDRFDHQARGDLSPAQHDVADAELAVDQVLAHPVVDALVAPAHQAEAIAGGQFVGHPPGRTRDRPGRARTAAAAARRPRPTRTAARASSPCRRRRRTARRRRCGARRSCARADRGVRRSSRSPRCAPCPAGSPRRTRRPAPGRW